MSHTAAAVDRTSPASDKIALFRSLFRGRSDVYPRRFESRKTGKSGYAPACANEWVRGICEKPRIKCAECPHRRFLPVTDDVIRWHLSGHDDGGQPFVAGVYPLLLDETCFFLAVDFDKTGWQEDATAFLQSCRRLGLASRPRTITVRSRRTRVAVFRGGDSRGAWRAGWDRIFSRRRWRIGRTSGWIRTIVSFRTRTRCRRADSGT